VPLKSTIIRYVLSLTFFPSGPWFSGQVWTLPVEIVFYIVIWALVATKRIEWLERLAWVLGCISLAYWVANTLIIGLPKSRYLADLLLNHGCYFGTGIVLAKLTTEGVTPGRMTLLAICIAGAMMEIGAVSASELGGAVYRYNVLVPCLAWAIAVAVIWASMQWRFAISDRLSAHIGFFKLLGALTYPLYLVHYQTGGPIFAALYGRGWPMWAAFIPAYAVALFFAFLIAKWLEPQLSRAIDRGLRRALNVPQKVRPARPDRSVALAG
jgi:peptidoglycan/LPS O-acetylase OafA/YrhL